MTREVHAGRVIKPVTAATAAWRKTDSFCLAVYHVATRRVMSTAGRGLFGGTG